MDRRVSRAVLVARLRPECRTFPQKFSEDLHKSGFLERHRRKSGIKIHPNRPKAQGDTEVECRARPRPNSGNHPWSSNNAIRALRNRFSGTGWEPNDSPAQIKVGWRDGHKIAGHVATRSVDLGREGRWSLCERKRSIAVQNNSRVCRNDKSSAAFRPQTRALCRGLRTPTIESTPAGRKPMPRNALWNSSVIDHRRESDGCQVTSRQKELMS